MGGVKGYGRRIIRIIWGPGTRTERLTRLRLIPTSGGCKETLTNTASISDNMRLSVMNAMRGGWGAGADGWTSCSHANLTGEKLIVVGKKAGKICEF